MHKIDATENVLFLNNKKTANILASAGLAFKNGGKVSHPVIIEFIGYM